MRSRIAAVGAFLFLAAASAEDKPGSKDDPLIPRYEGSTIIAYLNKSFDELIIPLAPILYDYSTKKYDIEKKITSQGEVTRLFYLVKEGPSALEVFQNYKNVLSASGFTSLFESGGDDLGAGQTNWFGSDTEEFACQLFEYSPDKSRYLAAEIAEDGQTIDVALYIIEYDYGTTCGFDVKPGQVAVQLSIVKSGVMADKMVTVSASDIEKGIDTQGHIAIYGINFDSNKADLKPESKASLDQVAEFMKAKPEVKIHVVGHTDNVGSLESNLKLSRARAGSVVTALVNDYGIEEARLNPAGVGQLAPIATNATEEGRAMNRRVELTPQ